MKVFGGNRGLDIISVRWDGPWPCERCGQYSQFAECTSDINRIFCRNERCGFKRIVDKKRHRILESDGSLWAYDYLGRKTRIQ